MAYLWTMPHSLGRIYRFIICLSIFLGVAPVDVKGQTSPDSTAIELPVFADSQSLVSNSDTVVVQEIKTASAGESLIFLGKKLAFEAKKRLNLTTEEEEKEEEQKKDYTLKFFGITFERKPGS